MQATGIDKIVQNTDEDTIDDFMKSASVRFLVELSVIKDFKQQRLKGRLHLLSLYLNTAWSWSQTVDYSRMTVARVECCLISTIITSGVHMILISWILCFPELIGETIQGVVEAQVQKGLMTFLSSVTKRVTVAGWIQILSPLP